MQGSCVQAGGMGTAAVRLPEGAGVGAAMSAGDCVWHGVPALNVHCARRPEVRERALQVLHL